MIRRAEDRYIKRTLFAVVVVILAFRVNLELSRTGENFEACLGDYLKDNGLIDANAKVERFQGSHVICRSFVKIELWNQMSAILSVLENSTESVAQCVRNRAYEPWIAEKVLTRYFYSISTQTPKDELEAKKSEAEKKFYVSLSKLRFQCQLTESNDLFISLIYQYSRNTSIMADEFAVEKDFCLKTYFKKQELLQSSFNLNPKANIKLEDSFCYQHIVRPYKELIADSYWSSGFPIIRAPIDERMCVIEFIEYDLILDKFTAVLIAADLGMTKEQFAVEKIHFDKILKRMLDQVWLKCYAANTLLHVERLIERHQSKKFK